MTLLSLVGGALAATLSVGPTETYTTINAALARAANGDTIRVDAGTYAENLDLRGKAVTLISVNGPARTTLAPSTYIAMDGGTLEGFRITPAPATAILIASGNPTLRDLEILAPSATGVEIDGGSGALVEEVLVKDAGSHAFVVRGGSPTIRRSIAMNPAMYGFNLVGAATVRNTIAIGGTYGYVFQTAGSTFTNVVGVGATQAATASIAAGTLTNSAFRDNAALLRCFSATPTFTNGIAYNVATASGCTGTPTSTVTSADPLFTHWSAATSLYDLDFRPTASSPMRNTGTGTDTDGSAADLGAFGGADGGWSDDDGDGVPVLFDCDDADRNTHSGASEIADGRDNDCDGIVDEDIPVDTGGDDTGNPDTGHVDTGDSGNPDSGPIDTDTDTDIDPGTIDLDGDGYPASVDCGEHNIATYPGAPERTDGVDNNCDGRVDEGTASGDADGDGWSVFAGDCDDTNASRFPGARDDSAYDGIDENCDGTDDLATGHDHDNDGYQDDVDDCDDTNAAVHPGANDVTDGIDEDCDLLADDPELTTDADGDGVAPVDGDCDDTDPGVFRGNVDIPDDFIDQDCDGVDNYDVDRDGDASYVSGGTDCDDNNSTVSPAHEEVCGDQFDNNCDGTNDEGCDTGAATTPATKGCGCAAEPTPAGAWAALLLVAAGIRRRRAPAGTANS